MYQFGAWERGHVFHFESSLVRAECSSAGVLARTLLGFSLIISKPPRVAMHLRSPIVSRQRNQAGFRFPDITLAWDAPVGTR